jgi:hypothetical protein
MAALIWEAKPTTTIRRTRRSRTTAIAAATTVGQLISDSPQSLHHLAQ